jgi:hypothetical protein
VVALDKKTEPELSFEKLVDRIILGPSISTALATTAVKRILEKNGKQCLVNRVFASTIPFRP